MTQIGLVVTLLALGVACAEIIDEDKNSMWRNNDLLMTNIDNYYKMLSVRTNEVHDRRKRFLSIFSQAYFYYVSSDEPDKLRRVQEAVNKTKEDLSKPSDVIAGQTRAYLAVLKTPIDQHVNDIRAACTPETPEPDCMSALERYKNKNLAACKEYNRNLHLYDKCRSMFSDPKFADFVSDVRDLADSNDEVALTYFSHAVLVEYADIAEKGRDTYKTRSNVTYPCSVYNLPLF